MENINFLNQNDPAKLVNINVPKIAIIIWMVIFNLNETAR